MTGYTVHTGSNDKFRSGWDRVFEAKKKPKTTGEQKAGKDVVQKPSPRKK